MSSGGTNTTTSSNSPPPQFLNAYQNVLNQAGPVASTPYTPYPGQIVAGMSPDQQAGIAGVQGAQGIADPYINSAAQHLDQATAPIWGEVPHLNSDVMSGLPSAGITNLSQASGPGITNTANAGASNILGAGYSFNPNSIQQFESPYTQDVVNATQAQFNNQNAMQQQGVIGNAISHGAWGGDRSAVAQGITAGQQQLAQAPVIAGLHNAGYQQATQAAEAQAAQRLQGATGAGQLGLQGATAQAAAQQAAAQQQLGLFSGQQAAQLGATQANRWLNSQAAAGMGNLGQEALGTRLTGANALLGTGGLEQTQAQAELNVPFSQYTAAQAYPFQTTGWMANIAEGLGGASGGMSSTTAPAPSVGSQIAGAGIAGAGILGQTGAFGNNGWLSNAWGNSGAGIDQGSWTTAAGGGRIPHRAPGGGIAPNLDLSIVPGAVGLGSQALTHGPMDILKDYGQTSTTEDPNQDSGIGGFLKAAGLLAASIYGGPAGAAAGTAFNRSVHFSPGGGIVPFPGRQSGNGIVSNDNWYPEPIRHRAAGGITMVPSSHGGPGVPILGGPTGGIVPISGSGSGISPVALSDYFTSQRGGQSFAPPPNLPHLSFSDLTGDHSAPPAPTAFTSPGSPTDYSGMGEGGGGGGEWRGGPVGRDEGGDIPDFGGEPSPITSPETFGIPTHGGPTIPDGIAEPEGRPAAQGNGQVPTAGPGYVPPPAEFVPLVLAASERHNVDPKQLAWLLSTESHWNPKAYNPQSGTKGLGQFKDGTAHEMGIDPWHPGQAIDGAAGYLRKKLNENGGDYERAIARYGTFSTGHGPEADAAVRARYRAFIQGAARGGGIVSLAAGGWDDTSDDPSGLLIPGAHSYSEPASVDPFDTPPSRGIVDSGGSTIPVPPIPPSSAGIAPPPSGSPDAPENPRVSPYRMLTNVGLGILGGTSPHAGVNVGKGALTGIALTDKEQNTLETAALRRDQAKTNAMWRAGQRILSEARAANIPVKAATDQQRVDQQGRHIDDQGRRIDDQGRLIDAQVGLAGARSANIPVQAGINQQNADTRGAAVNQRADAAGARDATANRGLDIRQDQGDRRLDQTGALNAARQEYLRWKAANGDAKAETDRAKADEIARSHGVAEDLRRTQIGNQADAVTTRDATTRRGQDLRGEQSTEALALRRQAMRAASDDRERALVQQASGTELRAATSLVSSSRDVMGKPTKTLAQALGEIRTNRSATPAPRPAAAPSAPAQVSPPVPSKAAPQFIEGKVYVDGNGNRAIYQNGKFEPAP